MRTAVNQGRWAQDTKHDTYAKNKYIDAGNRKEKTIHSAQRTQLSSLKNGSLQSQKIKSKPFRVRIFEDILNFQLTFYRILLRGVTFKS